MPACSCGPASSCSPRSAAVLTYSTTHGQGPADPPKMLPAEVIAPTPIGPPRREVVPAAATGPSARKPAPFDRFRNYDDLPELTREIVFANHARHGVAQPRRHPPAQRPVHAGLEPGPRQGDRRRPLHAPGARGVRARPRGAADGRREVRGPRPARRSCRFWPRRRKTRPTRRRESRSSRRSFATGSARPRTSRWRSTSCRTPAPQTGPVRRGTLPVPSRAPANRRVGPVQSRPGSPADADGVNLYPGPALAALAMSQRAAPATWKKEALARGLAALPQALPGESAPGLGPVDDGRVRRDASCKRRTRPTPSSCSRCRDWLRKLQYEHPDRPAGVLARRVPDRGGRKGGPDCRRRSIRRTMLWGWPTPAG